MWSRTQSVVALSSCEAELIAMSSGATDAKLVQSLLSEFGERYVIQLVTDSSSARAVTQRRGLGRLRHIALRELWLQQEVRDGAIVVGTVPTLQNVADILTKAVTPASKHIEAPNRLGVRPFSTEVMIGSDVTARPEHDFLSFWAVWSE